MVKESKKKEIVEKLKRSVVEYDEDPRKEAALEAVVRSYLSFCFLDNRKTSLRK